MSVQTLLYPNLSPSTCGVNLVSSSSLDTNAYSGVEYVSENAGEKWYVELFYNVLERSDAMLLRSFHHALRGSVNKCLIKDWTYAHSVLAGSPLVNGSGEYGLELNADGLATSSNIASPGDRFKLGERLHEITDTVTSNATGQAVFPLANELIDIPNDNQALITDINLLTIKCRWTNPEQIKQFQGNKRYYRNIRLSYMESLA